MTYFFGVVVRGGQEFGRPLSKEPRYSEDKSILEASLLLFWMLILTSMLASQFPWSVTINLDRDILTTAGTGRR